MKIPTDNFSEFLEEIRKLDKYVSDKDYFSLYDNIYMLEKKLLERDFPYFEIHIRWISELLFNVLYYKMATSNITSKANLNKIFASNQVNLERLKKVETLDNESQYQEFIKLKDLGNDYAHVSGNHTGEWLSEIRLNTGHIKQYIGYLESVHDVLNWLLDKNHVFNEALYYPIDLVLEKPEYKYLFEYKGTECELCHEGELTIPGKVDGNIAMPFGPYLVCDKCGAILSANLKLKEDLFVKEGEKTICSSCGEEMKKVHDYKTGEEYFICSNKDCNKKATIEDFEEELIETQKELFESTFDPDDYEGLSMEDITKPREEEWDDSFDPNEIFNEED